MPAGKVWKYDPKTGKIKDSSGLNFKEKKQVRKIVNRSLEYKYYDGYGTVSQDYTWAFTALCLPGQGDSDQQRTGDRVMPKQLLFKYQWLVGDATNLVRLVIFRLKTGTSTANIFITDNTIYSPQSQYKHDERKTFEILYDKMLSVDTYNPTRIGELKLNLAKNKPIQYDAGTTTYTSNGLYFAIVSDSAAVANPSFQYAFRTTYTST